MDIRKLGRSDAESYFALRLEALQQNPEAFASSYEEESVRSPEVYGNRLEGESSYTYGAFDEGNLIGMVSLVLEEKLKMKHRANIYAVYVTGAKRGTGVAKRLMNVAIEQAKSIEQIKQVYLTVSSGNEPAKRLYQSLGFECYGKDKRALNVNGSYLDEDLMVLYF
ncbi:RimJ/RimL family protein N-acetyltransferase [Bacillus tianshenii]|uniref:RimJ/RimL family protein N-acetyltransferase n=1 Tax=Sutcliffiella tianshenii TaxID=1463404 RepID=A0ABS2P377_9BACI|nr:GNAT family N-acetyltransferase [Bacillus tianshenii]MBM7621158.1 RimJ/RimL family protein N-acetyltransferase [Bacillus tianshenii]